MHHAIRPGPRLTYPRSLIALASRNLVDLHFICSPGSCPVGFELWIQRRNGNPIFCRANFSLRNMRPLAVVVSPEVFSLPLLHRKLDCHKRRVGELQSRHFDALCDTWFVSFQGRICKLRRGCTPSASSARPFTLVAQTCQAQGTTMGGTPVPPTPLTNDTHGAV